MKKNYDFIFILAYLFVFRIIALSGSFADAVCLIAILGYILGDKLLNNRKIENEVKEQLTKDKQEFAKHIESLSAEIIRVKNTTESIKAATGFINKR
jgi:hypothetical protein